MEPTVPFVTLITQHIVPSRAPFLLITVSGVVSVTMVTTHSPLSTKYWIVLSLPLLLTIAASVFFAYKSIPVAIPKDKDDAREDFQNQLRFSRSICLATPLLCLGVFTISLADPEKEAIQFWTNHLTCVLQVVVFLIYIAIRSIREEPESSTSKFNFAQFAMLTSAMLISAAYNLYQTHGGAPGSAPLIRRYFLSISLYVIWASCLLFWMDRVRRIFEINVSMKPED